MSYSWQVFASANSVKFDEGVRHAVYQRDGYKCAYCGNHDKTGSGANLSIDHITSLESGGESQHTRGDSDRRTNLITACGSCNSAKQDKSPRDFNAMLKAQGKQPADFKKIRAQAGGKIDLKQGDKNAKIARAYRNAGSFLDFSKMNPSDAGKGGGPGVQHDPHTGQFQPGGGAMIHRAQFRAHTIPGEALAIDPGASGIIAAVLRGAQPSPQAFGFMYDLPGPLAFDPEAIDDGVAILELSGPIEHHDRALPNQPAWCHSYEALAREVRCALDHPEVRAIALKIDSPGGVAAGMGETHRALRRMQVETGKPIFAFADEMACSAAYNVASACREIWTTPEGHVGSIGVILCTIDESKRLEKEGLAVRYVVTGERKADLHPGTEVTSAVLSVAQAKVDKLGRHFFRDVGKARGDRGLDAKAAEALQAGVYIGSDAAKVGLADGVASWDRFLRLVKRATMPVGQRAA